MRTFRFIGMVLFAILLCMNFASCSSNDNAPTEENEEGEVVVSGKKLAKIVGKLADGAYSETYTFNYDSKGRLIEATEIEEKGSYKYTDIYQLIWGDDAIKVIENGFSSDSNSNYTDSYIITLNNGLIQNIGNDDTFTYNKSNRFVSTTNGYSYTTTTIWDGDKLVSISDAREGDGGDATLTYEKSCKKGYFPFIANMIGGFDCISLCVAHPEIAGMRTVQLPSSVTWTEKNYYTGQYESSTSTLAYEFDKEGYISMVRSKDGEGSLWTYTLTWE